MKIIKKDFITINLHILQKEIVSNFVMEKRAIIYIQNDKLLQSDNPEYVIYNTDEKFRLMRNIISDSYQVDIEQGHRLFLCVKQDKDNEKRCHFKLIGIANGRDGECACGACNHTWSFAEDNYCDCE